MKRILALLLAFTLIFLSACGNDTTPTKKRKKKVIYVERETSSDSSSDSDQNNNSNNNDNGGNSNSNNNTDNGTSGNAVTILEEKVTATDIGKNYYMFEPKEDHPGVVQMDAKYEMVATDKRKRELDKGKMVLSCNNKNVKINGNLVTIPYSVRSSGEKVKITMHNKDYPNRTGTYTFDFAIQFTAQPTFLEEFNSLDPAIWRDDWYENRKKLEDLRCENGELIMTAAAGESTEGVELSTTNTFEQAYGCFSARIKMPTSGLSCVAFWLCTRRGVTYIKNPQRPTQSTGEIDIVEYYPTWGKHRTSSTVHWYGWSTYHQGEGVEPRLEKVLPGEYHVYSVVWTRKAHYFYVDDELTWKYTGDGVAPDSGPMQLLIQHSNPQKDNDWGGKYDPNELPNESRWDYVKVYGLVNE